MSGIEWWKIHHGAPTDLKWLSIADATGSEPMRVWGCFSYACDFASQNEGERGSIARLELRDFASFARIALDEVKRIFAAFVERGMIVGDRIAKFAKRQGLERVEGSTATAAAIRKRRQRERQKSGGEQMSMFLGDAPRIVTPKRDTPRTASVTSTADSEGEKERRSLPSGASPARSPAAPSVINFPGKKRSRADGPTWLSDDWCPDERDCQYAAAKGYDGAWVSDQCERFNNYHGANGSKFLDWHKAWRTWVLRAGDFSGGCGGNRGNRIGGRSRAQSGPITDAINAIRARRNLG